MNCTKQGCDNTTTTYIVKHLTEHKQQQKKKQTLGRDLLASILLPVLKITKASELATPLY